MRECRGAASTNTVSGLAILLAALLGGYLLGSTPFGLLLARAAGHGDLRQLGSGNIGATNAMRAGGPWLGAATLLLDAGKGAAAVLAAHALAGPQAALAAGLGAFLGHVFSVWLGFRGGKGVATMIGVTLAVLPVAGLVFLVAWAVTAAITRISSAGGLLGAASAPLTAAVAGATGPLGLFVAMAALVAIKHRGNITRLIAGTEPRIGAKH